MNKFHNKKYLSNVQDEHFYAGNVTGHFRRTSSLRLRGEKMVQRSPLTTRKLIPVITENTHQKQRGDGLHLDDSHRQRSNVSILIICKETCFYPLCIYLKWY